MFPGTVQCFDLISLLRCCLSCQVTFWMSTAVLAWQPPTSTSAIPVQQICPTSKGNFLVMFHSTAFCVPLVSTVCCVMNLQYCVVVIIAVYCQTQMPELSWRRGRRKIITISVSSKDTCSSCVLFVYRVITWLSSNLCFALCSWKAEKIQHKWQNKGIRSYDTQIQWSVSFFPWNLKLFFKESTHIFFCLHFFMILKNFWSKGNCLKLVLKTIINAKTKRKCSSLKLLLVEPLQCIYDTSS